MCTHTVWLTHGTLKYYGGNYAKFVATVEEEERLQLKVYEKQQADMEKLEKFVEVRSTRAPRPNAQLLIRLPRHACRAPSVLTSKQG